MPETCSVPLCRSNYKLRKEEVERGIKNEYVPVFRFPANSELREKWISRINRKNFQPTERSVVCIKHFRDTDIIRYPGSRKVQLEEDAVPSVFEGQPKYLTVPVTKKRTNPEERKANFISNFEKKNDEWLEDDTYHSYIQCFM